MASTLLSVILSVAFLLFSFVVPGNACGGVVHGEIAQRAKYLFALQNDIINHTAPKTYQARIAQWLQKYEGSVLAGSFMPDWGYGCSGADELAEKMHWPPFLKAAVQHIRETYPNPENDEKAQSLIAFIFAVSAHQVQDAAWHSIGLLMGFMMDVHVVDCHLDFECAHTTLDWGGDAIFSKRYSGLKGASDWAFGDWYVPVDDLAAIYGRLNMTISTWQMKYCIIRLRGVLLAAARGASIFFGKYAQKSPFMLDYFDEYYLGGIDDMTSTTVECWTSLVEWVRIGPYVNPWNLCPLTVAITRRTESPGPCISEAIRDELKPEVEAISKYIHAEDKDGIFRVWYDGPRDIDASGTSDVDIIPTRQMGHISSHNVSGFKPYARFGQSMAQVSFGTGGDVQLAVSSPYESHENHFPYTGDVHIHSVSEDEIKPTVTLQPVGSAFDIPGIRFGFSLGSFKYGSKNHGALAVGAPGWDPSGLVYIYTGSKTVPIEITPHLTVIPFHPTYYRSQFGKRAFGYKLFVADVDGDGKDDLLISAQWSDFVGGRTLPDPDPDLDDMSEDERFWHEVWDYQHGSISVFSGHQLELMLTDSDGAVYDEDCAYMLNPPFDGAFQRFGSSMAFAKKAGIVLVGAPGKGRKKKTDCGRGRVYGIRVTKEQRYIEFTIEGPEVEDEGLGSDFGGGGLTTGVTPDGTEWLAIGAHNADHNGLRQAGQIQIYTVEVKYNKTDNTSTLVPEFAFDLYAEEPQQFGKFGAVLESDGKEALWIGSGWANEEDGVVWRYNITQGLSEKRRANEDLFLESDDQKVFKAPREDYKTATIFAQGQSTKARFGDSLLVGDFNKDGVQDIAVGSPFAYHEDGSSPLAGKIEVFFLNRTV